MARKLLCTACGSLGTPQRKVRGSACVLVLLLFFFIVPGIIYLAWMFTAGDLICRKCGSVNVIPPDSPIGKKLLAEQATK